VLQVEWRTGVRHLESKHLRTLALAGLVLLTAAAGKPAWSGLPDWRRYLEFINPTSDIATELRHYQVGQVVSLDDPRFSATNVRWGLWVPQEFLPDTGAGLYFLQEYARDKIPILFVHGSGGNPTDFRFLIEDLDRSRYQPWVERKIE